MEEKYQEIISALLERISVLERELAETRKLLEEKDAVIAELKEQLKKNCNYSVIQFVGKRVTSTIYCGFRRDFGGFAIEISVKSEPILQIKEIQIHCHTIYCGLNHRLNTRCLTE